MLNLDTCYLLASDLDTETHCNKAKTTLTHKTVLISINYF